MRGNFTVYVPQPLSTIVVSANTLHEAVFITFAYINQQNDNST